MVHRCGVADRASPQLGTSRMGIEAVGFLTAEKKLCCIGIEGHKQKPGALGSGTKLKARTEPETAVIRKADM